MQDVFLLPGEAKFTKKPLLIATLFGSCVGVCLYDRKNRWGGVNHYMLPYQKEGGLAPGKYGDFAINSLIKVACSAGSLKGNLVASVIGGGNVTGHLGSMQNTTGGQIGLRNVEVAHNVLREHGIKIVREDVGGVHGRKIRMNSATNEINIRKIISSEENQARAKKQEQFRQRQIKILLVDDSATVRRVLRRGIELSDDMEVVGEAANPFEARELILECDPDVLCLDIIMPRLDGHAFLKRIMHYKPIPTVIVSTIAKRGSEMRRMVEEAGAVDVIDKEELELYKGDDILQRVLLPTLRRAAHATVRKR